MSKIRGVGARLVDSSGAPIEGRKTGVVSPDGEHLVNGIPITAWADKDMQHKVVLRGELMSVQTLFARPLQGALAELHEDIEDLRRRVQSCERASRPWYKRLWSYLWSPRV